MPNFFDKEKDLLNYESLQLSQRLEVKQKIHRILEFDQSQWLKPYIEFNTQKKEQKQKKIMTKMEKRSTD